MEERLNEEFPVDWEEDHYVSRREFFKFMTFASGGLALGSAVIGVWSVVSRDERKFERVAVARVDEVPVGGSTSFFYPRPTDLCILVQPEEGAFVAYSRRCTHLSCPVDYQHDKKRLYCPCHNGAFDVADGSVLQGPPPRALPRIEMEVADGQIFAIGVARGEA